MFRMHFWVSQLLCLWELLWLLVQASQLLQLALDTDPLTTITLRPTESCSQGNRNSLNSAQLLEKVNFPPYRKPQLCLQRALRNWTLLHSPRMTLHSSWKPLREKRLSARRRLQICFR